MRIYHRYTYIFVTKKLLYSANVVAIIKQMADHGIEPFKFDPVDLTVQK